MNRKQMRLTLGLLLISFGRPCWGAAGGEPADGTKKLTLHPLSLKGSASEFRFLPGPQDMTDGDAFPLYMKAIDLVPKDSDWAKIRGWREMPVAEVPQDEVGAVLRSFNEIQPLLEQAGRCKRCNWPVTSEGDPHLDLQSVRNAMFLIALKARSQFACGDCVASVRTLRTGLALARHLSDGPTAVHVLLGAAIVGVTCGELELYVQQADAPSLEAALRAIPQPFIYEEPSDLYGGDEASRKRVRLILRRANRHLIALQYIEALRGHATAAGMWPGSLSELKRACPDDPVTGRPFDYKRVTKMQAILEGPMPEGGSAKDVIRYELNFQPKER